MIEPPRYDRRASNQAFFVELMLIIRALEKRLTGMEERWRHIDRGVWCLVKTLRLIGAGMFAAGLVVLPEYGRSKGWW